MNQISARMSRLSRGTLEAVPEHILVLEEAGPRGGLSLCPDCYALEAERADEDARATRNDQAGT